MPENHPSRPPGEALEAIGAKLVWVCAGCDLCARPASEQSIPCNGPSHDGRWMVPVEALDRAVTALREIREVAMSESQVAHEMRQKMTDATHEVALGFRQVAFNDMVGHLDAALDGLDRPASSPGENEGERRTVRARFTGPATPEEGS